MSSNPVIKRRAPDEVPLATVEYWAKHYGINLTDEQKQVLANTILANQRLAVNEEREECAKIADSYRMDFISEAADSMQDWTAENIAEAIRNRNNTKVETTSAS